jgi:hypothetical protein
MIQGSNHPRTALRAIGQDTIGRLLVSSLIFFSFPLREQERLCGGKFLVQIPPVLLSSYWNTCDWRDTNKMRMHNRPTASVVGWPDHLSPDTVTSPACA